MHKYFNTLIVKFASPCNLNCTYCYEYNTGDNSWKTKPKYFSPDLAHELNFRIKEYLGYTGFQKLNIVAHGGEPLLLGPQKLDELFTILSRGLKGVINFGMQTNAVLVSDEIISVLKKHGVKCGVSIDGNKYHNRHRVNHAGKESYDDTIRGYHLLNKHSLVAGILSVVDFETNPIEVLDSLCTLEPKQLDLLQPFFNHDHPKGKTVLGDLFYKWFNSAFDYYMQKPQWHDIQIRIFEAALFSHFSSKSNSDWFGGPHGNYLVIESDGNYDILDHLKSIGSYGKQISNLCMNLNKNSFKEANDAIWDSYKKFNIKSPPDGCIGCEYEKKCGGGYYPTRFSSTNNSLNNPSVYCFGLIKFFKKLESFKMQSHGY